MDHYYHTTRYKIYIIFKQDKPPYSEADLVVYYCGCQCKSKDEALEFIWQWFKKEKSEILKDIEKIWAVEYNYYLVNFYYTNPKNIFILVAILASSNNLVSFWANKICKKHRNLYYCIKKVDKINTPPLKPIQKYLTYLSCSFCCDGEINMDKSKFMLIERFF